MKDIHPDIWVLWLVPAAILYITGHTRWVFFVLGYFPFWMMAFNKPPSQVVYEAGMRLGRAFKVNKD